MTRSNTANTVVPPSPPSIDRFLHQVVSKRASVDVGETMGLFMMLAPLKVKISKRTIRTCFLVCLAASPSSFSSPFVIDDTSTKSVEGGEGGGTSLIIDGIGP